MTRVNALSQTFSLTALMVPQAVKTSTMPSTPAGYQMATLRLEFVSPIAEESGRKRD